MNDDLDLDISNGATAGGGGFIKPAEIKDSYALIFRPKGSRNSSKYQDENGQPKQEAIVDMAAFATAGELDAGKPGTVMEDAIVSSGVLAKILIEKGSGVVVGTLEQTPPKNGRQGYWKINPLDPALIPKIKEYLIAERDAKKESLPPFMR